MTEQAPDKQPAPAASSKVPGSGSKSLGMAKAASTAVGAAGAKSVGVKAVAAKVPGMKAAGAVKGFTGPPTTTGVKDTSKEVAKGALVGATRGGWVGAAKGAAVALAKTSAGRKLMLGIGALALCFALVGPMAVFGVIMFTSNASQAGDTYRSGEAVASSEHELSDATKAMQKVANFGVPWELYLALTNAQDEAAINLPALQKALGAQKLTSLGAGSVLVDGEGRAPGKTPNEQAMAASEKERYVAALQAYGLNKSKSNRVYNQALAWRLGQVSDCAALEVSTEDVVIELPDKNYTLTSVQTRNITRIISEAKKLEEMTDDALIISLMAAMTESGFRNYANANVPESLTYPHDAVGEDHDSVGFWQMRQHWGSTKDLMTIPYQVKAFFGGADGPNAGSPRGLWDIPGWELMTKGEAAQAVEVSAFPDRYAAHEGLAVELLKRYGGGVACNGGSSFAGVAGHPLGSPDFPINSGFGGRESPGGVGSTDHKGIDFSVGCDAPIYAIADGTVVRSGWAGGWGNAVLIDHGNGLMTRSAHMPDGGNWASEGAQVQAGQQIGTVGTTGASTGCHLHLETLIDGVYHDPYVVLTGMGIELRWE